MKPRSCLTAAVLLATVLLLLAPSSRADDKKKKKDKPDAPQATPAAQTLPPAPKVREVQLVISNFTGGPVEMVWVDPTGAQRSYGQIPPQNAGGTPASQSSFAGHTWLFKSGGRVVKSITVGNNKTQSVTIGQPGAPTVSVTPPPPVVVRRSTTPVPNATPLVTTRNVPVVSSGGTTASASTQEFLKVHNDARARVGVAPLRWSGQLAAYAQQWADHLASTGTFQHRPQTGTGYGENIFGGSDGYTPADAARNWLEERAAYRGGPVTPQNFSSVGHYTQMVWSGTTEVGYGIARGRNGVVVVANYSPAGNMTGRAPY
jgi:pathogenesis-related protein 1